MLNDIWVIDVWVVVYVPPMLSSALKYQVSSNMNI